MILTSKMSASDPNSKIDLLEEPNKVKKKVASAYCAPGEVEGNGLIGFVEYVIFPISELVDGSGSFHIARPEQYGGEINYTSIEAMKKDFADNILSPQDLKLGVTAKINQLLEPLRKDFANDVEFQEAEKFGYPAPVEVKKTKKKEKKNKGSRYPGAQKSASPVVEDETKSVESALEKVSI